MATHNHPRAIQESGLQDGCPRCAEHALRPELTLDDSNLRDLIGRTQAWMTGRPGWRDESGSEPRSDAERQAMVVIESHLDFVRRAKQVGVQL